MKDNVWRMILWCLRGFADKQTDRQTFVIVVTFVTEKFSNCFFWQCIHQIFTKLSQFWSLLILKISKVSLVLKFGLVEAEIIEVKDTRGHFKFLHFYAWFFPVIAVWITILDFQNSILYLAILSVIFSI